MTRPKVLEPTLSDYFWSQDSGNLLRYLIMIFVGALILTASAKVALPIRGVPQNLMIFSVCMLGFVFPWRVSLAAIILYYLQMSLVIPGLSTSTASGSGPDFFTGPTGGFFVGHLAAAIICGHFAKRGYDRKMLTTCIAVLLAVTTIYLFGIVWLGFVVGWEKPLFQWAITP